MGLDELEKLWNESADRFNTWDELGLDEIVEFAMEVEREACAMMFDDSPHAEHFRSDIAAAIRSRTP